MYEFGIGKKSDNITDCSKAFELYQQSAQQGNSLAQYRLGKNIKIYFIVNDLTRYNVRNWQGMRSGLR